MTDAERFDGPTKGPVATTFFAHEGRRYVVDPPTSADPSCYVVRRDPSGEVVCRFLMGSPGWLFDVPGASVEAARRIFDGWMASAQVLARRVLLSACRTPPDPKGYDEARLVSAAARCVRVPRGSELTHLTQVRDLGQNRFDLAVYDDGTRFPTTETLKMGDCLPGEQVFARIGGIAPGPPHWMRWELVSG